MEVNNILICGDSFAAESLATTDSWTQLLAKDYKIKNVAMAGISEYKILSQLKISNLNRYDLVIISHTSPNRIHTLTNPLYSDKSHRYHYSDVLFSDVEDKLGENINADYLYKYFMNVFDFEYYRYVHSCCCSDIDALTTSIKTMHITHFEWDKFYQFENLHNFYSLWCKHKGNINHYDAIANEVIYDSIIMYIKEKEKEH